MVMFRQDGERVTTALLLAAGTGSRLQPLTDDAPKCLTEINGVPILQRTIDCLCQQGFKRLIVVVGHQRRCIREFLRTCNAGLSIEYVVNPQYRTTNNLFSLWLARERIQEPFLLLECDLLFDADSLEAMLYPDKIAVSEMLPWMNGTTVTIDELQRVAAFQIGGTAAPERFSYKTVNICSLSMPSWRRVAKGLDRHISAGRVNAFYETVFAELVADGALCFQPVFFDSDRWYEVDTLADVRNAERMLSELDMPQAFTA